jgi:alkylhydroperoxidase family enzyme
VATVVDERRTIGRMGALGTMPTEAVLDRVLGTGAAGHHDVRADMSAAHHAAWAATSPRLLELCRVRIATMLGCTAESNERTTESRVPPELLDAIAAWPTDPRFEPADRACLAFTEHYVIDVASVDDDTVDAVRDHLGDEGVQSFVSALLVVEQRIRLRLMWDRLFSAPEIPGSGEG